MGLLVDNIEGQFSRDELSSVRSLSHESWSKFKALQDADGFIRIGDGHVFSGTVPMELLSSVIINRFYQYRTEEHGETLNEPLFILRFDEQMSDRDI